VDMALIQIHANIDALKVIHIHNYKVSIIEFFIQIIF
jgi:hypothetical protein